MYKCKIVKNMFIIDLNYIVPLEEVDMHMATHAEHLQKYYDQGIFVAWGRKQPRTGGVILALADSKEKVEKIIREDPFYKYKLAEFAITEFLPGKYRPELSALLG